MIEGNSRKLRWDRAVILRFIMSLVLAGAALWFLIVVLDARSWGPGLHTFDYLLMALFGLLGTVRLIVYLKTKNLAQLAMGAILLLFIPYLIIGQSEFSQLRYSFYAIWGLLFLAGGPVRRRCNPHFRQVLELAAKPVNGLEDGFTRRPFPAGAVNAPRDVIVGFGNFLMKHWLVTSYIENERVVLALNGFSWHYFFFRKLDFQKITHITFENSGNVSVNISQKDYRKFRDQLTFDSLCASLGNLMKTFLVYYQRHEEKEILKLIDEEMARSHWLFSRFGNDASKPVTRES